MYCIIKNSTSEIHFYTLDWWGVQTPWLLFFFGVHFSAEANSIWRYPASDRRKYGNLSLEQDCLISSSCLHLHACKLHDCTTPSVLSTSNETPQPPPYLWYKVANDPDNGWNNYFWAIQLGLIDVGSSTCSLSGLLSAVETSLRAQTGLVIAQWASAAIFSMRVCVQHILAVATIRGQCLLCSKLLIVQRLFEGGNYSRAATIRGHLFEGADYSRAVTNRVHAHNCFV